MNSLVIILFGCFVFTSCANPQGCDDKDVQAAQTMFNYCDEAKRGDGPLTVQRYMDCMECFGYSDETAGKKVMDVVGNDMDLTTNNGIYKTVCVNKNLQVTCLFQKFMAEQKLTIENKMYDSQICANRAMKQPNLKGCQPGDDMYQTTTTLAT